MMRRMYPKVDLGGVGGPNFEAKISPDKERRTMEEIKDILPKKHLEPENITSISQTQLEQIVEKSGLPEDTVRNMLKEKNITVQEKPTHMPETTSETNATNNPKGTKAATESEKMKKKMVEMMGTLHVDQKAAESIATVMREDAQTYFNNAPDSIKDFLSSGNNELKDYYDISELPDGTKTEVLKNGHIAVSYRESGNDMAKYGAIYDPDTGKVLSKHTNIEGVIQKIDFVYDDEGALIGYSITEKSKLYTPALQDNMEPEGVGGHFEITTNYGTNLKRAFITVNGSNLNYSNSLGTQPGVGGRLNYVPDANGGFHLMTPEEYEKYNK